MGPEDLATIQNLLSQLGDTLSNKIDNKLEIINKQIAPLKKLVTDVEGIKSDMETLKTKSDAQEDRLTKLEAQLQRSPPPSSVGSTCSWPRGISSASSGSSGSVGAKKRCFEGHVPIRTDPDDIKDVTKVWVSGFPHKMLRDHLLAHGEELLGHPQFVPAESAS